MHIYTHYLLYFSLVATIKHMRPNLLKNYPDTGAPIITEEPPQHIIDLWTHGNKLKIAFLYPFPYS